MVLENLKIDYLLKNYTKIHFFGLGFIQLKLNDKSRMHFYHPELPPFVDEPHNHRYDFKSKVLKGKLINSLYNIKINFVDEQDYIIKNVDCIHDSIINDELFKQTIPCSINKICDIITYENSEYFLNKEQFHTITTNVPTITYIERFNITKKYAQIVVKNNFEEKCPFSKIINENELWDLVRSML